MAGEDKTVLKIERAVFTPDNDIDARFLSYILENIPPKSTFSKETQGRAKTAFNDYLDAPANDRYFASTDTSASMNLLSHFTSPPLTEDKKAQRIQELRAYMARSAMGRDILDYIDSKNIKIKLIENAIDGIPDGYYWHIGNPKDKQKASDKGSPTVEIGYSKCAPSLAMEAIILAHEVRHSMQYHNNMNMVWNSQSKYGKQLTEVDAIGFQNMFAAEHLKATSDTQLENALIAIHICQNMPQETFDLFKSTPYADAMRHVLLGVFTFPRQHHGPIGRPMSAQAIADIERDYVVFTATKNISRDKNTESIQRLPETDDDLKSIDRVLGVDFPNAGICFNYFGDIAPEYIRDPEKFTLMNPAFEIKARKMEDFISARLTEKLVAIFGNKSRFEPSVSPGKTAGMLQYAKALEKAYSTKPRIKKVM